MTSRESTLESQLQAEIDRCDSLQAELLRRSQVHNERDRLLALCIPILEREIATGDQYRQLLHDIRKAVP